MRISYAYIFLNLCSENTSCLLMIIKSTKKHQKLLESTKKYQQVPKTPISTKKKLPKSTKKTPKRTKKYF